MATYLEDYAEGETYEFGRYAFTEQNIIAFAREFDPQAFHVDPQAAAAGPFGGLVASGFHTLSAMMRLLVDHFISPEASLGSPGMGEIRWLAPVRPGDVLGARLTVTERRLSRSRPDRGALVQFIEMVNQDGTVVMTAVGTGFYRRRPRED
ncbi:MAG: MaoC family dehydratase [Hyphomicrobiales bacterium]|nr:MaoC family dehydratase [Hyphomicrobiales bacterium]MCP5370282.1 MaoC family dehydratase [Hyphomicrobiales bacterium]